MFKPSLAIWILLISTPLSSQNNIYESSTFKFLNIPSSARHNYLGKAAIATFDPDIDIAAANPALIQYNTRGKLLASSALYFTSLYGNVAYGHNIYKYDIPFIVGANFINYGTQTRTDINGNILGKVNPSDLSIYMAASKTYEHYNFGINVKLAYGNYIDAQIGGVAADFSMLYRDVEREIYATVLLKNIGYQFVGQNSSTNSMPFDIQMALSKKLKHMPLRFTIMMQEVHRWNTLNNSIDYYNWPLDPYYERADNGIAGNILSKFVFASEISIGQAVKLGLSYDVRKSIEGRFEAFRGLNGLALGFGVYTRKYDFGYSFSRLTPISVNHQFTLSVNIKEVIAR